MLIPNPLNIKHVSDLEDNFHGHIKSLYFLNINYTFVLYYTHTRARARARARKNVSEN